ncbi:MAG: sulfotransferase [Thermodesulfobacteriota bacterium]
MKRKEVFPDFFILGAIKCGTTSLYAWLRQHPEIFMSDPKEPRFFEKEYKKGLDFYWEEYFGGWNGERLTGDARVGNLYFPYVPERIHSVNPDARFILSLRNPIDRALSHWWMHYRRRRDALLFEDAVKKDYGRISKGLTMSTPEEIEAYEKKVTERLEDPYRLYIDAGYYAEQIERYLRFFPRERFKIILFEDLCADSEAVTTEACEFLGVDPGECEDFDYSMENTGKPLKRKRVFREFVKRFSMNAVKDVMSSGLEAFRGKPRIEPETRKWLAEHYRPHNKRLEGIIGKKLDHWG